MFTAPYIHSIVHERLWLFPESVCPRFAFRESPLNAWKFLSIGEIPIFFHKIHVMSYLFPDRINMLNPLLPNRIFPWISHLSREATQRSSSSAGEENVSSEGHLQKSRGSSQIALDCYMCVCVYIYMYVCIYICTYKYVCICIYRYTCLYIKQHVKVKAEGHLTQSDEIWWDMLFNWNHHNSALDYPQLTQLTQPEFQRSTAASIAEHPRKDRNENMRLTSRWSMFLYFERELLQGGTPHSKKFVYKSR